METISGEIYNETEKMDVACDLTSTQEASAKKKLMTKDHVVQVTCKKAKDKQSNKISSHR